jgi:hypothetical protein
LIFSRLYLKRRFQFFGISDTSSVRTLVTFLISSSSITRRSPALPAFSHGTITVLTLLPHQLPLLFLHHQARSVVGIDDLVPLLEVADVDDVLLEACLHGLL